MTSPFSTTARRAIPYAQHLSPAVWQTGLLFGVDMITNVADYGFHVYLGWALPPGAFAAVQTLNAVLLVVITAGGVMQPVVARYVAATQSEDATAAAIFRRHFLQSGFLGALLLALAWLGRAAIATALNVPPAIVTAALPMLLLVLLRPVVAGMLQGRQQFVSFGITRTLFAIGRLALVLLLVGLLGGGAVAAVATMPLAALLALAAGLLFVGPAVWRRAAPAPAGLVWAGWRLSLAALLAYTAYMGLLNLDLIWANRTFAAVPAGSYAAAVVLRRVLAVLPGAILVVFYPRVVAQVTAGQRPDRLLLKAGAAILSLNALLTALYFLAGPLVVRLMFGGSYAPAAPLLGWMGLAMCAYGLAGLWLNLFLATRPAPFVLLLAATLLLQVALLALFAQTLLQTVLWFMFTGWLLAVGGLLLYVGWLRRQI